MLKGTYEPTVLHSRGWIVLIWRDPGIDRVPERKVRNPTGWFTAADWLVYNLNLLQIVLEQGFHPRSRAGLTFRQDADRRPGR